MTSGLSFHVIYDGIADDPNSLRVAIATLRPRVINLVSGARKAQAFSFAIELLKKYPNMRVIYRDWPDDGLHATDKYKLKWHSDAFGNLIVDDYSGCQRWVDDHQNFLLAGLTVLTDNESVNDTMHVYAAWQAKIMDLCGAKGWKVAVGRFAVGNPREADYARMGAMWRALAKWHPLHTFSPNEYLPQDIKDASGMVGRYLLGIQAAKAMTPPAWPFDVSIGEYGVVYRAPDGGLDAYAGYSDSRIAWSGAKAFKYLYDQWVKWYKPYGVDVSIFCWGDDDVRKWSRFRIDTDNGFIKALTDAHEAGELQPMATAPLNPPYSVTPLTANSKYKISTPSGAAGSIVNLRNAPVVTTTSDIGDVPHGAIVTALEEMVAGAEYWVKIRLEGGQEGWVSRQANKVTFTPYTPPVVVEPEPPIPPAETLYAYTLSFTLRSPAIEAARLTAIENGLKAIISGMAWLGQGIGTAEVEVKVSKAASTTPATLTPAA